MKKTVLAAAATLAVLSSAHAYEAQIRKGQLEATPEALLAKASKDMGVNFNVNEHLFLVEKRELATSNYSYYVQVLDKRTVAKNAVRIWSNKLTGELILAEMNLDPIVVQKKDLFRQKLASAKLNKSALSSVQLTESVKAMVTKEIAKHDTDAVILDYKTQDMWLDGDFVREIEVQGRRGTHFVTISLLRNVIVSKSYHEFPQSETFSMQANVFPMYEEVENTHEILPYEVRELKHIYSVRADGGNNPMSVLGGREFDGRLYAPIAVNDPMYSAAGYWSRSSLRSLIDSLAGNLPQVNNDVSNGILLQGKYASIQIHPDAKSKFAGIEIPLAPSLNYVFSVKGMVVQAYDPETGELAFDEKGNPVMEERAFADLVPGILGKPIKSEDELLTRIPFRSPKHDPVAYINQGFDEQQVYYAVTTLMESLNEMGFTDKVLSEKPFHAFLYNPDIGMRNNAYYTDDTINFTTYTAENPNLARDNPTIWHELGHGVMDRLMGEFIQFEGTKSGYGGLSEGMADFIAKLIVEYKTNGSNFPGKYDFRIMNNTGFYLTNELHDEGEAYGGAMQDALMMAIKQYGRDGLVGFTDLTLETMRLTRNHPSLSPKKWFQYMIIADELGSSVRSSGQFTAMIEKALESRNFSFAPSFAAASMKVTSKLGELTNTSEASRENATIACDTGDKFSYDLTLKLTAGDSSFISFPATVKVEYQKGALQGAIAWDGEEVNPTVYVVNSADEILNIPLRGSMTCEDVNQPDGACKDYAYIQIFSAGLKKPVAKKRFYVMINGDKSCKKNE